MLNLLSAELCEASMQPVIYLLKVTCHIILAESKVLLRVSAD